MSTAVVLTEAMIRDKHPLIYKIFFLNSKGEPVTLQRNESLHDYYTRKGLRCFCRECTRPKPKPQISYFQ